MTHADSPGSVCLVALNGEFIMEINSGAPTVAQTYDTFGECEK
jgi:hypothetical protein